MSRNHHFFRLPLILLLLLLLDAASLFAENRTLDGAGNNLANLSWGSAGTKFTRLAPPAYVDGISIAPVAGRPNPRAVGVNLMRQLQSRPSARRLSGFVYAFGNLISHDIQHTIAGASELIDFRTPQNDDMFFPGQRIDLTRSQFDPETGTSRDNPREQLNFTTAFLDGSAIYGSDELTASILRGGPVNPTPKLRTSSDINGDGQNLLPRDAFGPAPNAPFIAGDDRVNDNVVLSCMHTVFMREHNRLVDELQLAHPTWSSDELYERARKIVGAELQSITFYEFLPALLGPHAPSPVGAYDPAIDPTVLNEFPTVFLRVGHSMLTESFKRVDNDGRPAPGGALPLEDAFFNPAALESSLELDRFLKGLSLEIQEETDLQLTDGIRFGLLDAIDIQRGRDHGMPDYNTMREAYGLPRIAEFGQITRDELVQRMLAQVYGNVDSIDAFVGALAEDHLPGASVGPLVAAGYVAQFTRLRRGDRFWFEFDPDFAADEIEALRNTTLADIIARNTGLTTLQANVFFVPEGANATCLFALLALTACRSRRAATRPARSMIPERLAGRPTHSSSI